MVVNQTMESPQYTILVVDDEELIRNLVVTILSRLGHSCVTAIDGVDALRKIKENQFDAVITDIRMPNMDGIILTREMSKHYPSIPVMVMTVYDEEFSAGTAISVGAREFIKKPFSPSELGIRLHKMIGDSGAIGQAKSKEEIAKDEKDEAIHGNDQDKYMEDLINDLAATLKEG